MYAQIFWTNTSHTVKMHRNSLFRLYNTAKFAAKAFWGASKLVGKGVRAVGRGAIKGVKKMINLAKAGKLGKAI